jgi:hypothetical protein
MICSTVASCPRCQVLDGASQTCVFADAGTDPKGDCALDGGPCQRSTCDGQGTCNAPYGTPCGPVGCSGSNEELSLCNASGSCAQVATACPQSSACAGARCSVACTTDGDCASGTFCQVDGGLCLPPQLVGEVCTADDQCASGHCLQGQRDLRCSSLPSCPTCQVIDPSGTTCIDASPGTDPKNECTSDGQCELDFCNGSGSCHANAGDPCGSTTCNTANGQLVSYACDANGTCQSSSAYCPMHLQCRFPNQCPTHCQPGAGLYCQPGYTCIANDECQ